VRLRRHDGVRVFCFLPDGRRQAEAALRQFNLAFTRKSFRILHNGPAASTARTSSASRQKSADKIDGATMIDLCGAASGMA
jgi:hypothetical protein